MKRLAIFRWVAIAYVIVFWANCVALTIGFQPLIESGPVLRLENILVRYSPIQHVPIFPFRYTPNVTFRYFASHIKGYELLTAGNQNRLGCSVGSVVVKHDVCSGIERFSGMNSGNLLRRSFSTIYQNNLNLERVIESQNAVYAFYAYPSSLLQFELPLHRLALLFYFGESIESRNESGNGDSNKHPIGYNCVNEPLTQRLCILVFGTALFWVGCWLASTKRGWIWLLLVALLMSVGVVLLCMDRDESHCRQQNANGAVSMPASSFSSASFWVSVHIYTPAQYPPSYSTRPSLSFGQLPVGDSASGNRVHKAI